MDSDGPDGTPAIDWWIDLRPYLTGGEQQHMTQLAAQWAAARLAEAAEPQAGKRVADLRWALAATEA